ncbi:MAG TPA: DoxX family protein [Puia sp.]|nr:DoxX family protein [Puia sp.]
MEATLAHHSIKSPSKARLWAGRVIIALCVLFLLFDAIMKVIREAHTIEASVKIGWPEHSIQGIGVLLLICTILYIIPRTAFFGAILLTAYLGGATAINLRAGYSFLFPVIFAVLVWLGLYLRDNKLSMFISSRA